MSFSLFFRPRGEGMLSAPLLSRRPRRFLCKWSTLPSWKRTGLSDLPKWADVLSGGWSASVDLRMDWTFWRTGISLSWPCRHFFPNPGLSLSWCRSDPIWYRWYDRTPYTKLFLWSPYSRDLNEDFVLSDRSIFASKTERRKWQQPLCKPRHFLHS